MLQSLVNRAREGAPHAAAEGAPQQASHGSQCAPHSHQHASHGSAGHSHKGHGGNNADISPVPRTYSDKCFFDYAVIMGATHPDKYTVSLRGSSVPSSDFAFPGCTNQTRAQRYHQQTASRTPALTKATLSSMGKAISYGEDQLDDNDIMMGRTGNIHYKLPIVSSTGRPVFAAISSDFLPHLPRDDSIGRPAIFPRRLWRFSRAFWADYFPGTEASAAIAQLETSTEQHNISKASRTEGFGAQQMHFTELIYVPRPFSGFEFPCLYADSAGLCWPLIDIAKQKERGAPFLPWQNKREGTKYFAFAPCPVDPFDLGPPLNPLVSIEPGQHPKRVERLIAMRGQKAAAFVDRLEKIIKPLQQRMVKVGIGQITLANKEKVAGCVDCSKPFADSDQVIAIPCGGFHVAHPTCLKAHLDSLDLLEWFSCPSCGTDLVEEERSDETGTAWFVPDPKRVRSVRDEVARREGGERR